MGVDALGPGIAEKAFSVSFPAGAAERLQNRIPGLGRRVVEVCVLSYSGFDGFLFTAGAVGPRLMNKD
jgi:hypothetical protein